jgi:hypothetical protein
VLVAFRQRSFLRLYDTFAALKIADIAHCTPFYSMGFEELELFVSSLILTGKLNATLLQSSNTSDSTTLRFSVSVRTLSTAETMIHRQLVTQRRRLKSLMASLEENDKKLELSKEHVDTLRRNRKSENASNGCPIASKGDGLDFELDEDIMGDLP